MPSISASVQSYRNPGRTACATSPTGTVLVLMDPRPIIIFLLNYCPACYQRSAHSTATLGCVQRKPHLNSLQPDGSALLSSKASAIRWQQRPFEFSRTWHNGARGLYLQTPK